MKKHLLPFLIFLILVFLLTFPLVFKINTHIPGFFSTSEPFGVLWGSWAIKYLFLHKLPLNLVSITTYPFGLELYPISYRGYLWMILYNSLSVLTNPAFTYNFQVLLNFLLSAVFTYLLIFLLTKNRLSSIFAAIVFAFCPYQFMRAWQHLGLTYNEWLPLCILSAILLKEKPTYGRALLFLSSIILLFSFNYCVTYLGLVTVAVFLTYTLFYNWKKRIFESKDFYTADLKYFKKVAIVGIVVLAVFSPQVIATLRDNLKFSSMVPAGFNFARRPFEELFANSARPLSYLLPAAVHPIFGKITEGFIGSPYYGISFSEHTLYLGWTPIILALIAFRRWYLYRRKAMLTKEEHFYLGFFVFLAMVAWFFSQPPWWRWGPLRIYMPSFFMYKVLPMYRAYCRFGIVVMLAVAVLAGFGLKFLLERFKTSKSKLAITFIFCSLTLFEFWNYPPFKIIDVSRVPQVYYWLKEQPGDFAVAEYPFDYQGPNEMYKFYQIAHQKKLVNYIIPGTIASKVAQTITKLSSEHTTNVLKWMEVKYVVVHRGSYLDSGLAEDSKELSLIPHNRCLKLVKSFPAQECPKKDIRCVQETGPLDVYEVFAKPVKPEVLE